jgi:hypothetical protein
MEEHFPGSSLIPEIGDDSHGTSDPLGADSRYENPVLVDKHPWLNLTALDQAFKHFGKLKCPGPEGFRPIVLCHFPDPAGQALLQIYNAVIELEYTPMLCCGSDIVFLPRPGKEDYADHWAFQPVSLMPFLFKALERLVKCHMEDHADTFHPDQHAF